jgi:uncharacterized paraquat-inducible protein A
MAPPIDPEIQGDIPRTGAALVVAIAIVLVPVLVLAIVLVLVLVPVTEHSEASVELGSHPTN